MLLSFLLLLDHSDIIYMNAPAHSLHLLESVYHGTLRFITGSKPLTHHCTLYSLVDWSSSVLHRMVHWYQFIYKSISGFLPSYFSRVHVKQTVQSQSAVSGHHYIHCSISSYRGREDAILLFCSVFMEYIAKKLSQLSSPVDFKRCTNVFVKS